MHAVSLFDLIIGSILIRGALIISVVEVDFNFD